MEGKQVVKNVGVMNRREGGPTGTKSVKLLARSLYAQLFCLLVSL